MAFTAPLPVHPRLAFPSLTPRPHLARRARAPRAALTQTHIPLPARNIALELLATPPLAAAAARREAAAAPPAAPPVLFVHGSLHAAWCFRRFLARLAAADPARAAAAVSLRGYTSVPRPPAGVPIAVDEHVDDLVALLRVFPGGPPVVVAHSFGGLFAQKAVAAAGPGAVAGLVLLASTPPAGNRGMVLRTVRRYGLGMAWRITVGFVRRTVATDVGVARDLFFTRRGTGREVDEGVESDAAVAGWMEEFAKAGEHVVDMRTVTPLTDRGVADGMVGRVLVVGGEDDVIVDEVALWDAAEFWRCAAPPRLLPRCPHDLMLATNWETAFDAVYSWIRDDLPPAMLATAAVTGSDVADTDDVSGAAALSGGEV